MGNTLFAHTSLLTGKWQIPTDVLLNVSRDSRLICERDSYPPLESLYSMNGCTIFLWVSSIHARQRISKRDVTNCHHLHITSRYSYHLFFSYWFLIFILQLFFLFIQQVIVRHSFNIFVRWSQALPLEKLCNPLVFFLCTHMLYPRENRTCVSLVAFLCIHMLYP